MNIFFMEVGSPTIGIGNAAANQINDDAGFDDWMNEIFPTQSSNMFVIGPLHPSPQGR